MINQVASGTAALLLMQIMTVAMAQDDLSVRQNAAASVAAALIQELGSTLKTNMAEDGPEAAITVCRDIAPTIANDLSLEYGWKVTRVGTRVRNTMMGIPDAWEQHGLAYFSAEIDAGAAFEDLDYTAVITEGNQRYFRFMKPIVTQPLCLGCHGPSEALSPAIQTILDQHYPHDQAINYAVGEIRGAVSIKQPLE